ncbi:MAG: hypothetical protein E7415_01065 [Ruminococcaceae bacterium]|nr:hypothetical protein [Oscillospiraceae bacterium]
MKKSKLISALVLALGIILIFASCGDENIGQKKEEKIPNPTPQSFVESYYKAWQDADGDAVIALTCEPMWKVEAKSEKLSVKESKAEYKKRFAEYAGSEVYYKILETKEYKESDEEYKRIYEWAKSRYNIEIEGYAFVRASAAYDKGEPFIENMEIIKYKGSWYGRDLLGI